MPLSDRDVVLRLSQVNVSINGHAILHDINWELKKGENWAIFGPNGSGKSTLLRLIRGEIWPQPINGGTRTYFFNGEATESPIGVKRKVALVSAEQQTRYMRQEWLLHGWQIVFTGLFDGDLLYRYPTTAEREWVHETMARVGIGHLFDADYAKLSQGNVRKLLIARALVSKPPVMVLDEVGVGLDPDARRQILDVIEHVVSEGTQIVYVTHRREELLRAINHVMELRNGRIVKTGQRLEEKPHIAAPIAHKHRANGAIVHHRATRPLIEVANANVAVDEGRVVVLHDINWQVKPGENWLVYGHNGAGKTTLLKLILGEYWTHAGGEIRRFGKDFTNVWEIKRRIGYFASELQVRYDIDIPTRDVIITGFYASIGWLQNRTPEQIARADELIEQFGLQALAQRSLREMSFGQARKVLIARALANRPKLLLLDEPFDGLDIHFRAELGDIFEALTHPKDPAEQANIILVSHYGTDTLSCITHKLKLEHGRIVEKSKIEG
jgi:molybdate transport system ATP-binding protein